jgi:hypothetical protein
VDIWEYEGRKFEVVMASDVINDGMGLELTDLGAPESRPILEVSWHGDGSRFDFICHGAVSLPFDVVERFMNEARRLQRSSRSSRTSPRFLSQPDHARPPKTSTRITATR